MDQWEGDCSKMRAGSLEKYIENGKKGGGGTRVSEFMT